MSRPGGSRSHVTLVAGLALAVRLVFLAWSLSGWYFLPTGTVNNSYLAEAYGIAAGFGYVEYFDSREARLDLNALKLRVDDEGVRLSPEIARTATIRNPYPGVLHPPGLPLLLAGLHRLLRTPVDIPYQVLGLILDAITACLVLGIAGAALGPRVGLAAGLAYAFFPPAAFAAVEKTPIVILTLLIAVSLACLLRGARSEGRRSFAWFAAVGLVLGVGAYFRSDYVLLPVFYGLALWAFSRRFLRSVAAMGMAQAIALALLLPWAYRNHEATGHWILTSTAAGAVMIHGLGMFENPWGFGMDDSDRVREAAAQGIPSIARPEADAYFKKVFRESVAEHPIGYVVSVAKRLPAAVATPYSFGLRNPWRTRSFTETRLESGKDRYAVMRSSPAYILVAYWDYLAMAGLTAACSLCVLVLVFAERRQAGLILLLLSPHLYSLAVHLLVTHMQPYYVLPSAFCWLFGLGYVLARGWRTNPAAAAPG